MSKKLVSLFLVLLMVFSVASSLAEGSAITVTDMEGREITLSEPATRIVAIYPSDCEIVCAIGCEDALVGTGLWCSYPASIVSLPKVQSGNDMNAEEIIKLDPQVVLLNTMVGVENQVKQLEENGITVVTSSTSDIASVYYAIRMIGALMDKNDEAEALIADMQGTFDDIKSKSSAEGKKIYFEVSPPQWGLCTAGGPSYLTELAEICGLTNVFGDIDNGWPYIDEEQVVARNPDYIVLLSGMGAQGVEEILSREGWGEINAIKDKKVYNDDDSCMTVPGPRLKEAALELYNFVYGTEAEEEPAA